MSKNSKKTALVVVDLQQDFLPPHGSLAIAHGRDVVPFINALMDVSKYPWSAVIATQDWHPPNHISFASQHDLLPFATVEFRHPSHPDHKLVDTFKTQVWPEHCLQNTFGSSLDTLFVAGFNQLDKKVAKHIVKKGYLQDREYYSCFKDIWKLHKTEMESLLRELQITDVVFVGLAYDFCVLHSAIDCRDLGFNSYVIKSCCKSVTPSDHTDAIYTQNGVQVLDSIDDFAF